MVIVPIRAYIWYYLIILNFNYLDIKCPFLLNMISFINHSTESIKELSSIAGKHNIYPTLILLSSTPYSHEDPAGFIVDPTHRVEIGNILLSKVHNLGIKKK